MLRHHHANGFNQRGSLCQATRVLYKKIKKEFLFFGGIGLHYISCERKLTLSNAPMHLCHLRDEGAGRSPSRTEAVELTKRVRPTHE